MSIKIESFLYAPINSNDETITTAIVNQIKSSTLMLREKRIFLNSYLVSYLSKNIEYESEVVETVNKPFLPENKFFVEKSSPMFYEIELPIINVNPERKLNIISQIQIICKKDLLILQNYFQNYPNIEKKYKIFPILPHTKYILLYQDLIHNNLKSLALKSNSVEINYLIVNLQNFRIFKFDKLSYITKEMIIAIILFSLIIIFLFRR